jgi:hypothetical protein
MVDPVQPPPPAFARNGAANSNYPASSTLAAVAAALTGERPNTVRPLPRVRTLFRDRLVEDAREREYDDDGNRVNASELARSIAPWATPQMISAALAFLAQQIAQEVMASGMYFEPWNQVIAAYQRRLARITRSGEDHRLDLDG